MQILHLWCFWHCLLGETKDNIEKENKMLDSDQNDLQDEIAELSQPGPDGKPSAHLNSPSLYEAEPPEESQPPKPSKKPFPLVLAGFVVLVLVVIAIFFMNKPKPDPSQPTGDMGPGIVAASGLRGHLVTQWQGKSKEGKLQYQLRIEAMQPSYEAGFALVVARPPAPLLVNFRLLDATGFALCGKEVLFHFDPTKSAAPLPDSPQPKGKKVDAARIAADRAAARQAQLEQLKASEADRERGKDMFQAVAGSDGMVNAVTAQGDLPCSADLYQRANYWDLTTNFPTIAEQEALRDPGSAKLEREKELPEQPHAARRKVAAKPLSAFYIQGDDRATRYDNVRAILEGETGKSFQIDRRLDGRTASQWATNYSLIHYRCDQHSSCALTIAGGVSAMRARLNE
jgi:hypothetical protein